MKKLLLVMCLIMPGFAVQKELGELFNKLQLDDKFDGKKVIAVMPFTVGEKVPPEAGRTVSEFGVVNFHSSGRYTVVDRQNFSKLLEERELAQSDLVDESQQQELAKILAADRILMGNVTESFGKRLINAKILSVENGEVIASGTATVGPASMDDFMKDIMGEKGQVSATLVRSAVFPGWGQLYSNHPVRGGISMTAFLAAVGYTAFTWFQVLDALDKKNEEDTYWTGGEAIKDMQARDTAGDDPIATRKEFDDRRKKINQDYDDAFFVNQVMLGVVAGVYVLNLVDATLAGLGAKKKFDLYFSGAPGSGASIQMAFRF